MSSNCDNRNIHAMLVPYVERVLAKPNVADVEKHLKECPTCAAEVAEIRKVIAGLGDLARRGSKLELRPHPSSEELYNFAIQPSRLAERDRITIDAHVLLCEECQYKLELLSNLETDFQRRVAADGTARRVPVQVLAALTGEKVPSTYLSGEYSAADTANEKRRCCFLESIPARFNLFVLGFVLVAFLLGACGVYYAFKPAEQDTSAPTMEQIASKPIILGGWLAQAPTVKDERRLQAIEKDLKSCGIALTVDNLNGSAQEESTSSHTLPAQRDPRQWKLLYVTHLTPQGGQPVLTATYMSSAAFQQSAEVVKLMARFFGEGRSLTDTEGAPNLANLYPNEDLDIVYDRVKEEFSKLGIKIIDIPYDDSPEPLTPEAALLEHKELCPTGAGTLAFAFFTPMRRVYVDTCKYLIAKKLVDTVESIPMRLSSTAGNTSLSNTVPQLSDSDKVNALMKALKDKGIEARVIDNNGDKTGYDLLFNVVVSGSGVPQAYYVSDQNIIEARSILEELGVVGSISQAIEGASPTTQTEPATGSRTESTDSVTDSAAVSEDKGHSSSDSGSSGSYTPVSGVDVSNEVGRESSAPDSYTGTAAPEDAPAALPAQEEQAASKNAEPQVLPTATTLDPANGEAHSTVE